MNIMDGSFGMAISRIYVITLLTAIVIVATAAITTMPTPSAEAQQHTVHIIKDATNSYTLSGSSSHVGSFDTTYRIAGETSAIRSAENLIISTITHDFRTSPTTGYVKAGSTSGTGTDATHPNPFATPEQLTERITSELKGAITEAENNTSQGQHMEIKCNFGMTLEDMRCHYGPLPQAR
jgi:S-formylglutathione hydrolase FrmB